MNLNFHSVGRPLLLRGEGKYNKKEILFRCSLFSFVNEIIGRF